MASTYSTNLGIELIGTGDQSGTWGATTNTNLGTLLEQAVSGYVTQAITDGSGANTTITIPNGATGVARNMFIEMTGALTFATTSLIVPANKKMYFVYNNTSGGFAVTVKVSGQTGILVPNGKKVVLTCNGTDIVEAHTAIVGNATMGGTLGVTGVTTVAAGSEALPAIVSTTGTADTGLWFPAADTVAASTGGSERIRIDSSGNVGIGTSSPVNLGAGRTGLTLNGSTDSVLWMLANGGASGYLQATTSLINLVGGNNIPVAISATGTGYTQFITGGSERARIDSSGNLLVGTATVVNTGKVICGFNGSSAVGFVANDTASASGGVYFGCSLNGTFIGSIQRVGATSAVVYNTTSDQRLKSNIKDANPVLSALLNVKVRQYDWTDGDLHQKYGFVAQELESVLSGIVTKGKTEEDMWQLDYSRLTPHLVKAIQELSAKNDALEARLVALESR